MKAWVRFNYQVLPFSMIIVIIISIADIMQLPITSNFVCKRTPGMLPNIYRMGKTNADDNKSILPLFRVFHAFAFSNTTF